MRLERNIYKKETSEIRTPEELRRLNIQNYLIRHFNLEQSMAIQVSNILERTSLKFEELTTGKYNEVVKVAINEVISNKKKNNNQINDVRLIRQNEKDEHISTRSTTQTTQSAEEEQKFQEQKQKAIMELEQRMAEQKALRDKIRRNRLSSR